MSGKFFLRPLDPRDGNEWVEVGEVVSMDMELMSPEEEAAWLLRRAREDLDLIPEFGRGTDNEE